MTQAEQAGFHVFLALPGDLRHHRPPFGRAHQGTTSRKGGDAAPVVGRLLVG